MQNLQFEAAWDKTISDQDRLFIEEVFQHTKEEDKSVSCCLIRTAINHKQQMLITTLIHNRTGQVLDFQNREVSCTTDAGIIAQIFTIKALKIPPYCSMPWTFIFDDSTDFLFTEIKQVEIEI